MFYEVTFETGRTSVAEYADDEEAKSALLNHHSRALSGEPGGPIGAPAERIAKVRVYKKHPNEYNPEQTMSADVLEKEVKALIKAMADDNGVVDISRFAIEARAISHPTVTVRQEAFGSIFKMAEDRELDLAFLAGDQ